jgi:hypothetical protein
MTDDRSLERAARSWLENGPTQAPDRAVEAALLQIQTTSQERDWHVPWRLPTMNTPARVATAAVIGVLAVGGALFMLGRPGQTGVGGPGPSPTPTASPSPTVSSSIAASTPSAAAAAFPDISDQLAPGVYFKGPGASTPARFTFTMPAGWTSAYGIAYKDRGGPAEMAFGDWIITNVYTDPCQWQGSLLDPAVGPTVDDLAAALVAQKGRNATAPTDVTLGGYPAKRIELSLPEDLDSATCDKGVIRAWLAPGEDAADWPAGQDFLPRSGQLNVVYIVDVDGARLVIDSWHMPGTSAANLAELQAIVDSIQIEP